MKSTLVQQMQQLQQLVQRQQQQHPDPDKNVQQFIALARQNQMELMRNIQDCCSFLDDQVTSEMERSSISIQSKSSGAGLVVLLAYIFHLKGKCF